MKVLKEIIAIGEHIFHSTAEMLESEGSVPWTAVVVTMDDSPGGMYEVKWLTLPGDKTRAKDLIVSEAKRSNAVAVIMIMEMELVKGVTLSRRLSSSDDSPPPTFQEVLSWMEQIASGLHYLHNRAVAVRHGDLKLDNLILTPEGKLKIADFGQSRTDEGEKFAPTDLGGTWLYMAPEMLGLENERGHCESDIYSFGVTAYRALTGRFPRQTVAEVYTMVPFPRPCELNSAIPAEIDEIICRCLDKRPTQRYSNGGDLLEAIRRFQAEWSAKTAARVPKVPLASVPKSGSPYDLIEEAYDLAHSGHIEEALERMSAALQRVSTNPALLEFYADLNKKIGRAKIAGLTYQRIAEWMENHGIPFSERKEALEQLGNIQITEKHYEDAVKTFSILFQNLTNDIWIKFKYGVALGLAARFRESIRILEEVRKERPNSATLYAKIGFAYLQLKDTRQAVQYFNEALMLNEFEPTALYHMAILRWLDGRHDRAMLYYQRLTQIECEESRAKELGKLLGIEG